MEIILIIVVSMVACALCGGAISAVYQYTQSRTAVVNECCALLQSRKEILYEMPIPGQKNRPKMEIYELEFLLEDGAKSGQTVTLHANLALDSHLQQGSHGMLTYQDGWVGSFSPIEEAAIAPKE